jgi:hypothetical protein
MRCCLLQHHLHSAGSLAGSPVGLKRRSSTCSSFTRAQRSPAFLLLFSELLCIMALAVYKYML